MAAILKKHINDQHNFVLDIPLEDGKSGTVTIGTDILISDCRRNEENEQIEIWIAGHSSKNGDSPDIIIPFDEFDEIDSIKLYSYFEARSIL